MITPYNCTLECSNVQVARFNVVHTPGKSEVNSLRRDDSVSIQTNGIVYV